MVAVGGSAVWPCNVLAAAAAAAAADTKVQDFLLLLFDCVKQRITLFCPDTLKRPWDRDPAKVMCHWAVPVCLCTACKHCDKFPRFFNTW